MKTLLAAIPLAVFLATARAAEPPVTVTVEPEEAGQLIYAPMGALSASIPPTGRLWFKVHIHNDGGVTLTLTSIRVTMSGIDISIPRNLPCPAGVTTRSELVHADGEIITVPHPAPGTVTIRLYFSGNPTPKQIQRALVPYAPATANGQFLYPADEGDIGPNEYFTDGLAHTADSGQGWGADWKVHRVIAQGSTSSIRAGGSSSVNADHLGWGVPIRAMADGVVLRATTGRIDNPTPGTRAFQKMAEFDGEAISDVKVTRLSTTRAASLQRLLSGAPQLSIWETADLGRVITRLGSSALVVGEAVTEFALDELSSTRIAAIFRLSNGNQRLVVWDTSGDGQTVTRTWSLDGTGVLEVSLMKMASNRFATGVRTSAGDLRVNVWEVDGSGIHSRATDSAGAATFICTTALSASRVAISLRTSGGALKVIVWDLLDNGNGTYTLDRQGEATGEAITRVAASKLSATNKWATAFRTDPGGVLKLIQWAVSDDGQTVTPEITTTTTQSILDSALAAAPASDGAGVAIASIRAGNVFAMNGWGNPDENSYEYTGQNTAGAVTKVSLDELDVLEHFVGVRTTGGALKIMTWHLAHGGGNNVVMLHGDCRVLYAHFIDGSLDTSVIYPGASVAAGQMLGRMGNSGSSSGPHTHIHSERIFPITSIEDMLALEAAGTPVPRIGTRPIPFTGARAMELSQIAPGGEGNTANAFATMNGQGMYNVSLGIRPRLNTRYVDPTNTAGSRNGRKEPVPGTSPTGGPTQTVAGVLPFCPSGARLYIRGGSYDETLTFTTPMTVRRYDYYERENNTDLSAIIGK